MSKYANGHVTMSFSMRDVLNKDALEKQFSELTSKDFKPWFVSALWQKSTGFSCSDENGADLPESCAHELFKALYR